jgi:thiamine-monophosphate kinase
MIDRWNDSQHQPVRCRALMVFMMPHISSLADHSDYLTEILTGCFMPWQISSSTCGPRFPFTGYTGSTKGATVREGCCSQMPGGAMLDEVQIINLFFEENDVPVDDCAYLPETSRIITCDSMVENTHFRLQWHPPDLLAKKLFHSNLSDIAAGGGDPEWCLLQVGLPRNMEESFLKQFAASFREECRTYQCALIGGDTFRSNHCTFSVTMAGRVRHPLKRRALSGDAIYMTGTAGLSLAGLKHLTGEWTLGEPLQQKALRRHLAPEARLDMARRLRNLPDLHGMMDLSDGLLQDLERFARAAGLRFHLHLKSIPCDAELAQIMPPVERAVSGEEYELIFCASPDLQRTEDFDITQIGRVLSGDPGLTVFEDSSETTIVIPESRGFEHF